MSRSEPRTIRHPSFHGRIGVARADITPPVGVYARNWGAAKHDVATSIHRPLTLTALALTTLTDDQTLVLIDTDLGGWRTHDVYRRFQQHLLDALNLEAANVIISLSHTHSAPPLMDADDSLPGGSLVQSWMADVFNAAVHTARQAIGSQFEGTLDWHMGHCSLAANRDLADPEPGQDRFICGYNPAVPADDALLFGRVTDETGAIRATLVNYACHPTTLAWQNAAISSDYVGAMRETIEQTTGAPTLFLQGASGELAPRFQYVGDLNVADRHGRELGFAALSTLFSMEPPGQQLSFAGVVESGAPLAVWTHEPAEPCSQALQALQIKVQLQLKDLPTVAEIEAQLRACTDRTLAERLVRKLNVRRAVGDGSHYELVVQAWRLGDAVLVGSSAEAYSILQRELRRRFPDNAIICMNLINGSAGYLPPRELYDADLYQVWQTPFDRGSLELVIEAMAQAISHVLA